MCGKVGGCYFNLLQSRTEIHVQCLKTCLYPMRRNATQGKNETVDKNLYLKDIDFSVFMLLKN